MTELDKPASLGDRVGALTDKVGGLRVDVAGLRDQLATTRGRVWWVALLAVVALGLAMAVGATALQADATDSRVDAICHVLALVVGGADPSTRTSGPDRDAYVASLAILRQAYYDARCAEIAPLVPPRKSSS